MPAPPPDSFDVIIVGTGFGANVVVTELLQNPGFKDKKILLLERGAWWVTPERPLPGYLEKHPNEPIQYWPRPNNQKGLTEMLSVVKTNTIDMRNRHGGAPQPLYYFNSFEDVDILTSSGVGGGSLIYSNVSVRPHESGGDHPVMEDWPAKLKPADYDAAAG